MFTTHIAKFNTNNFIIATIITTINIYSENINTLAWSLSESKHPQVQVFLIAKASGIFLFNWRIILQFNCFKIFFWWESIFQTLCLTKWSIKSNWNVFVTVIYLGHCTMIPLLTRSCLKSSKLRPILNGQFCHAISKNIGLKVLGSKQPREILVFVILTLFGKIPSQNRHSRHLRSPFCKKKKFTVPQQCTMLPLSTKFA